MSASAVLSSLAAATEAPAELLPARTQMGFTLGFHIILVPLGVVFPLMMLIANYLGLRRHDPDYMRLAERWSKVAAVTFAVGAVTTPAWKPRSPCSSLWSCSSSTAW